MKQNVIFISLMFACALVFASPADAKIIFEDDFDDGVILDDGWKAAHFEPQQNGKPHQDVHAVKAPKAYKGTSAELEDDVAIYHEVDASSYEDLELSYCRKTGSVSKNDRLKIGWKKAPLGNITPSTSYWTKNWNQLESMNNGTWDCVTKSLPASADHSKIYLAFFLDNGENDFGYVDEIELTGKEDDKKAPVIKNISHAPMYPVCTDDVTVCANITDDSKLDKVKLNYKSKNGQGSWLMHHKSGDLYCGTISPTSVNAKDTLMITYDVYAEDVHGNSATSKSAKYTYDCKDPVADAGGPYACDEGSLKTLDASASNDTVDPSLSYAWELSGDGKYDDAFVAKPKFTCLDDGTYKVSVKVTDDAGHTDTADSSVKVSNVNPVAHANGPYYGNEGSNVMLNGTATDAGKVDTHTFAWDLDGDKTFETKGATPKFHCVDEGKYPVSLLVTDDDGGNDTDTTHVVCHNLAPVVTAGKDIMANEGENFTVTFSFTDAGVKDYHQGLILWKNVTLKKFPFNATSPLSATHSICNEGVYTITGAVEDNAWAMGHDNMTVTIKNVAPVFDNLPNTSFGVVDSWFGFDVKAHDQGCDTLTYKLLKYPKGMAINPSTGGIAWKPDEDQDGDHTVIVEVSDGTDKVNATLMVHVYDYKLNLKKGLNLISIPLVPEGDNTSINNVFGKEVSSNAEIIWSYTYDKKSDKNIWRYNEPIKAGTRWTATKSRVQEIVPGYGYYILMANDTMTFQDGKKMYGNGQFEYPPQVALTTGWNLIGKYGNNIVNLSDEVQDLSGGILTDLADLNVVGGNSVSVDKLIAGEGYWTFVTGQSNLLYAPSAKDYEKKKKN